jgi:hydrazine synthase alpha subunit-like protein/WD40 repeat protein
MSRNLSKLPASQSTQWLSPFLLLPLIAGGMALLTSCGQSGSETGSDPGIEDFPVAYVKRSILVDDQGDIIQPDLRRPLRSTPGGDLFLKTRATISAPTINITSAITNSMGDVKDLDVSSDGKLLVFSLLKEDLTPNDDSDNPKWDIYTYNRDTRALTRVITSDIAADLGDDIAPYFLPNNNRIVFSSNRQKTSRSILLTENSGKPQFSSQDERNGEKALVLHVMDIDGSNIKQISFNQSHDLDPVVLSNGRILFSRWDNMNRNNAFNLYTVLQDGSDLQPYYGTHDNSHEVPNALDADGNIPLVQFTQPREMSNGRIMLVQRPFSDSFAGGEIVTIDATNFVDLNQPTTANQGAMGSSALQKVTGSNLMFDGTIPTEGRYSSFYPLDDSTGRILVSKGLCQVEADISLDPATPLLVTALCNSTEGIDLLANNATAIEAYPSYGIWLFDSSGQTEKPVVLGESGKFLGEAVVMRPYQRAVIDQGKSVAELEASLITEEVGLLNIRSVYDFGNATFNGCFFNLCTNANVSSVLELGDPALATPDQRPARFIRLVKAVGLPNRRDPDLLNPPNLSGRAFGRGGRNLGMKEIIGYSPIQPDGSVLVKVPANIAFYFDILDKDARRIGPRHENWLQVSAGDTLTCTGCHTHPGGNNPPQPLPHGRKNAEAASINITAPAGGFYPNTQDPLTMAPYLAGSLDTMAEALSVAQGNLGATPSVNVVYDDIWTDPVTQTQALAFTFAYTGITVPGFSALTTPGPYLATSTCETQWSAKCRTVINYQDHIQPIWDLTPRLDAVTNLDVTCTSCHSTVNPVNMAVRVPSAQLDLSATDPSDEEAQHIESYRELFFNDNFQNLVGTALVDETIQVPAVDDNGDPILDNNGNPTFDTVANPDLRLSPTMRANGARFSFFMEKMTGTELDSGRSLTPAPVDFVDHSNMLTQAELRLISEYLDIGGQYFNNPFDTRAPQN